MAVSMTGFARAEHEVEGIRCTVEVRGVNHRFLDVSLKSQSRDMELAKLVRDVISAEISRGSIEVYVSYDEVNATRQVRLNEEVIQQYITGAELIKNNFPIYGELELDTIIGMKDAFQVEESAVSPEKKRNLAITTLNIAMKKLMEMRSIEGEALAEDIAARADAVEQAAQKIEKTREAEAGKAADKLRHKIEAIFEDFSADKDRVITEVAIQADKSDIAEEITRLASHLNQLRKLLKGNAPCGRKLEFITQELNREVNTIGSKSNIYEISNEVVEIKSNLEKIREQSANIE